MNWEEMGFHLLFNQGGITSHKFAIKKNHIITFEEYSELPWSDLQVPRD